MKYIITENRLHEFINSYLNEILESNLVIKSGPFIYIEKPPSDVEIEEFPYQYMGYNTGHKGFWIERGFLNNFGDWFAMDDKQSSLFIKNWFERKFGVEIKWLEISLKSKR